MYIFWSKDILTEMSQKILMGKQKKLSFERRQNGKD